MAEVLYRQAEDYARFAYLRLEVGAFPVVYATLFSAFYLPLLLMLAGLTQRGSLASDHQTD